MLSCTNCSILCVKIGCRPFSSALKKFSASIQQNRFYYFNISDSVLFSVTSRYRRFSTEMASVATANANGPVVKKEEMHRFMVDCMTCDKVKASKSHADQLADVLIAGDYRGHYSHGLNRLDMYVRDVRKGVCQGDGQPKILNERAATAWVDGANLLGPVVGNYCMNLAVEKARQAGVGWVSCKGSNHFGIAGWYTIHAANQGMLGMSFTNTSPFMVPTRSKARTLGTNPLSLAAPGEQGDQFVLDMATTSVAVGKLEIANRKGERIPKGWAVGAEGHETTDPGAGITGGLMPLGGAEESSGYKGYGLGMMVEIFCGILADAAWGPNVRNWMSTDVDANLGQCFIAIDPTAFAPDFRPRMQALMDACRRLESAPNQPEVWVAGDPERKHMALCDKLGGIPYHEAQVVHTKELAEELGVRPPAFTKQP